MVSLSSGNANIMIRHLRNVDSKVLLELENQLLYTAIFCSHIVGTTMSVVVTWISYQREMFPTVVRLERFEKRKKTILLTDPSPLFTILDEVQDKPHVVVLDGYVQNSVL